MASPQGSQSFASNHKVTIWEHDPGGTSAVLVSPDGGTTVRSQDMRDFRFFGLGVMVTIATTGPTLVEIVSADDADLSTGVNVIKATATVAMDAVGDWVWLECTSEEIQQESTDGADTNRYVGGRITCGNNGDEAIAVYIAGNARFPQLNLTPATTIS